MKPMVTLIATLLLLPAVFAEDRKPTLSELSWIAGCWSSDIASRQVAEQWMKPAGKMMLGMSRTVRDGKTTEYEFMRIVEDASGDIHYVAKPSGQTEAAFKLVRCSKTEVIFENPTHDFPQRIIYILQSDGSLLARIEGLNKGKEKKVDFPMKRTSCD